MSYPQYDNGLGMIIESSAHRDRVLKERNMSVVSGLDEVDRYIKKKDGLTEEETRLMIKDSMERARYDYKKLYEIKQQMKKAKWEQENRWYHETYGYSPRYAQGY